MYYDNKGNQKCSRKEQRIKPFPYVNSSVRKNGKKCIHDKYTITIKIMNEPYAFESER